MMKIKIYNRFSDQRLDLLAKVNDLIPNINTFPDEEITKFLFYGDKVKNRKFRKNGFSGAPKFRRIPQTTYLGHFGQKIFW